MEASGNGIIATMRRRKVRFPRGVQKPIRVLSDSELQRLLEAADKLPNPWWCSVARLMVSLLTYSGLRRKEFRLLKLVDLDVERWRILVSHPKGEGSWAAPDYAYIAPQARRTVLWFLEQRLEFLGNDEHEALVPYRRQTGEVTYWSDPMLGKLKAELERISGVRFSIKTFRPTFAQKAKDSGAPIEAVSRAMRHASTRTTEQYYARIRADNAFSDLDRAFGGSN
jgi:integrase